VTPAVLRHAEAADEVARCFAIMRELRPHLRSIADFVAYVERQRPLSYRLLAAWRGETPVALAGYRVQENLVHGRHVFVDDLVATETERRNGHGARLLATIAAEARRLDCRKLVLGAALDNPLGHRFYFRQGMLATGLSFSLALD
jgi:GNAT superfamily N-acetyltransferase